MCILGLPSNNVAEERVTIAISIMARNRTESTGSTKSRKENTGANVERYRKQIAKHDTKKSKSSLKETLTKAQKKENAPSTYKDVAIMVAALCMVCACVYILFYAVLSETSAK